MPRQNDLEQKALQLIINSGDKGLLQSDLWRKLGASSREGSRIALKLENKGLIRREKELYEGRWTYRLYPTRTPTSINSILDCPCTLCPDGQKCGPAGNVTPQNCERLTAWILQIAEKNGEKLGDD
ncbi:transcriptional regulator [Candidatus Bathyarchaeota archaeon]|nr:transcriptional regulator [Candidatus Bathyarchaeota archaeon]